MRDCIKVARGWIPEARTREIVLKELRGGAGIQTKGTASEGACGAAPPKEDRGRTVLEEPLRCQEKPLGIGEGKGISIPPTIIGEASMDIGEGKGIPYLPLV